ncbi:beta-galactosidase trimerization domain-containing protein [Roseiflexus sp.]
MTPPAFWIDPRWQALPPRPWRKIHLDFHNSHHIPRIGERFNPDEFGDRLRAAHVDAIVVFAKDMHGYFYYPTAYGPVHPGLSFDMLGMQVEACRKRNIRVYAYYCTTWDNYLAEQHPEWLVWKRDRTTYLPKFDEPPGWTALCLSNADFVQLVLDHTRETLERYDLDGIWYDMPLPIGGECFCRTCLAELRAAGDDPFNTTVQRRHKQRLMVDFMQRAHEQAHAIRPGCQVDQNNQTRLGLGERAPLMDNIDIEALPTAFWGYLYFPTHVRYARTFGRSVCGMSGRFHRSWADFGGLKHPNQLRTELAGIIAHGAQCDLGDQLPPHGRLDSAVYQTIRAVYADIERLEPFLAQAAPVTEAAILVQGNPLDELAQTSNPHPTPGEPGVSIYGLTRLLMECQIQFDIVEPDQEFERYRLVVLPDTFRVDPEMAARLRGYLASGGAVIACHHSLLIDGDDRIWAEDLGLAYRGVSPFAPAYMVLSEAVIWRDLPAYEYALYDGALRLTPQRPDYVLANLGEPLFQRSAAHYTSHAQTPFDHLTGDAVIALHERMAAIGFPIGTSYHRHGYWIYREVFRRLQRSVLPCPLVETSAPASAEVTVTHQAAAAARPERWMVHVVNFSPVRRSPEHCEYLEDPIPLRDVRVALRIAAPVTRAYTAADGIDLPLRVQDDRWEVTIPQVMHGEIAVFEVASVGDRQ